MASRDPTKAASRDPTKDRQGAANTIDLDFEFQRAHAWESQTPKTPKPSTSRAARTVAETRPSASRSQSDTGRSTIPVSAYQSTAEPSRTVSVSATPRLSNPNARASTSAARSDFDSQNSHPPSRGSSTPYGARGRGRHSRANHDRGDGLFQVAYPTPFFNSNPVGGEGIEADEAQYESIEGIDGWVRDNDADRAERTGAPPDSSFQLPLKRHPEFDARFFGLRNSNLHHIAYKTSTHLSMPTVVDDHVILMWGTPAQIAAAKRDLHSLYEQVTVQIDQGQRRVGGWIKINAAPTDRKQLWLDKQDRDAAIRHKYRHPPGEGECFEAIGIFIWPVKEINPQNFVGGQFEALDPIRFDHKVYIIFSRKRSMFRVLGDNAANVNEAIERLYGIFCEIACKNHRANKLCLVQPPSKDIPSTIVRVNHNHDLINRQITIQRMEQNKGIQVYLEGRPPSRRWREEWDKKRARLQNANNAYIKKVLQQGLQDVSYFRGHVKLKVYFGRLVLFGYKKPQDGEYSLNEFMENIRSPQTLGEVIRHLGTPDCEASDEEVAQCLIRHCQKNSSLFWPVETNTEAADSSYRTHETDRSEQSISATFDINLSDEKGNSQDVRLEVNFEPIPDAHRRDLANGYGDKYKPGQRRWLRIGGEQKGKQQDFNANRRKGPIDVKVLDLESDIAYQIELATWQIQRDTDIYPIFREFCKRLRIEEISDEWDERGPPEPGMPDQRRKIRRVTFVNLPGIQVEALTQKTKWSYWVHTSSYIFEITKYEHLPVKEVRDRYPDGVPISYSGLKSIDQDTRWGAALSNDEWHEMLSEQRSVEIGRNGTWDTDVDSFFRPSGSPHVDGSSAPEWCNDGVAEFLGRIDDFVTLIRDQQDKIVESKKRDGSSTSFYGSEEFDE